MAKKVTYFAWSPLRTLMKDSGAEIVSRDAVETVLDHLTKEAKEITNTALEFARHSGRKKISAEDMKLSIENM